jgi:D-amino-acid oxidase
MSNARSPIAVIGAGVIGLSCAIRLRERGHPVAFFAERRHPDITSSRAGAVFSPFRADGDERIRRWTEGAYDEFVRIAAEAPDSGVSLCLMREYMFTDCDTDPWWASLVRNYRRIRPAPAGYSDGFEALVPRMAMARYMLYLERRFLAHGSAPMAARSIADWNAPELSDFRVIVNCTGVGARRLANDPAITATRGQVLHLPNTLGFTDAVVEEGRGEITTYLFPFDDYIVLGGTYERDQWQERTDEPTLAAILDRVRDLLRADGDPRWQKLTDNRLRAVAGLRPTRIRGTSLEDVRLEAESAGTGRWIVHCYGHGRAGVTMSWGSADDVVTLIDQLE